MSKRSFFSSIKRISPVRPITIFTLFPSLFKVLTVLKPSKRTVPSNFANKEDSMDELPATPPTWNVRRVNCVPGSPIDWAAMIPTESPRCAM